MLRVGLATTAPPVAAVYHTTPTVDAKASFASKVCIGLASHSVILPELAGADGAPVIVKVTAVLVKLLQLPEVCSA